MSWNGVFGVASGYGRRGDSAVRETVDLVAAGRLLAERQRRHRVRHPLFPAEYEDPVLALVEVTAAWEAEGASGAVLVEGGEVTGYLLGAPKPSPVWGDNVWVERAGQAAQDPECIRELYGVAATKWMADGKTAQYVVVPDEAEMVDAWFRLGFGAQHAHAVRPVPAEPLPPEPGLTVRRARRDDILVLAELDLVLPQHQGLAPVFSAGEVPTLEEALADWEQSIDDRDYATFVAERNGVVIGSSIGCSMRSPARTAVWPSRTTRASWRTRRCFRRRVGSELGAPWVKRCSTGLPRSVTPPS